MDSFRIKIPQDQLLIKNQAFFNEIKSSGFSDSPKNKHEKTNNQFRNSLVNQGQYAPKFGLVEVNFGIPDKSLTLEFSAAKLVHGTNLREISEADFSQVIGKLKEFLKTIGVGVFEKTLENSTATLAAYARNIPVGHLGNSLDLLRLLIPFDYRPRSGFTVTFKPDRTRAELKYFNDNTHLILYAKLAEVVNNPVTDEEKKIAQYYKSGMIPEAYKSLIQETLRLELTYHSKFALGQVMKKYYGRQSRYTFKEVFKDKIRDELLQKEVDQVFNHPLKEIVLLRSFDQETFNTIADEVCKSFSEKAEMRLLFDIFYTRGIKAARDEVLKKLSERAWFRKQAKLKQILADVRLPKPPTQIDNVQVLEYLLSQFGIESKLRKPKQLPLM